MAAQVSTGKPISINQARKLRDHAKSFANDKEIKATLDGTNMNTKYETRTFYNHLDSGFVFDYKSLKKMMAKIEGMEENTGGLIVMMGASMDANYPERLNKPTVSVFACKITKTEKSERVDEVATYELILSGNEDNEDDGVEHPGLVDLSLIPGKYIIRGEIKSLNPISSQK